MYIYNHINMSNSSSIIANTLRKVSFKALACSFPSLTNVQIPSGKFDLK